MAATLIPAIIPESLESLDVSLDALRGATQSFQIDIVDGVFVPFTSWPYTSEDLPDVINSHIEGLDIEFDLMIQNPEESLDLWLLTTASRFIIHIESTQFLNQCIEAVRAVEKQVGIAINNDTDILELDPHIPHVDFVQCMGIAEIGTQGNTFDERVLDRVTTLRRKYPELEVAVDGSVNADTISRIAAAGANRLASGSALVKATNPEEAYAALAALIHGQ